MDDRQCLLVIIGATEDGHKERIALETCTICNIPEILKDTKKTVMSAIPLL